MAKMFTVQVQTGIDAEWKRYVKRDVPESRAHVLVETLSIPAAWAIRAWPAGETAEVLPEVE